MCERCKEGCEMQGCVRGARKREGWETEGGVQGGVVGVRKRMTIDSRGGGLRQGRAKCEIRDGGVCDGKSTGDAA